ncbi:MAG: putative TonB-dependent receptor [Pseudomonadota bacterium]
MNLLCRLGVWAAGKVAGMLKQLSSAALASSALIVSYAHGQSPPDPKPANPPFQLASFDPVVVTASRLEEPQGQATVLVDIIDRREIEASGVANITELLDRLPGVNVTRQYGRLGIDASVDIGYLGGGSHHRTLILVDGVRLNDIDDGALIFGSVPLSAIERIEVRRAGGGVLFGDRALGGVMNIITKPEKENKTSAEGTIGSFGLRSAGASLSRIVGEATARLDINRSVVDGYRRDSYQAQTGLSGRLRVPTRFGEFGATVRASDENLRLPQSISASTFQSDPRNPGGYRTSSWRETRAGGISLDTEYSSAWSSSVRFIAEDLDRKSIDPWSSTIYETTRNTITADFVNRIGTLTGLYGAEIFDASSESNRSNRNKVNQRSTAFYASLEQSLADAKLMAGLRSQEMENGFSPTSSAATQSTKKRLESWSLAGRYPLLGGVLRGGIQSSFAFPTADQLYTFQSVSPYAPQNIYPGVDPMRSNELQLSWVRMANKSLFEVSARRIVVKDEIGYKSGCDGADDCNDNLYDTIRDIVTLRYVNPLWTGGEVDLSSDFVDPRIDSGANSGKQLPMTPRRAYKAGVHQIVNSGRLSLYAHYRASMVQSADDSHSYPRIPSRTVYDFGWGRELNSSLRLQVWVRNVTGKRYYDFAQYGSVAPADGRSMEASLRVRF